MTTSTRRSKQRREERRKKLSARKRAAEHKSGFSFTSFTVPEGKELFKVEKSGVRKLDIIPFTAGKGNPYAEEGEMHFERTFYVHRGIGADSATYVCPKETAGKPCPICDFRREKRKEDDVDEELLKDLAPRERQLWNVYDHDAPEKGVQLWEFSYHNFGKQLDAEVNNADEDDGYEFFADPEEGMTLKVGFGEKSLFGTKFFEAETIHFKPRREPLDDELLEQAVCLDELIKIPSYDELKKIFLQEPDDDEPSASNGRSSSKKAGKTSSKSSARQNETFDDDDDNDDLETTAAEMGIKVGTEVHHTRLGLCTVTHISKDGTSLRLRDEDGKLHHAIAPADCTVIEDEEDENPKKAGKSAGGKAATRKMSGSRSKASDDDEDDDWEDDEEDEDDDKDLSDDDWEGDEEDEDDDKDLSDDEDDDDWEEDEDDEDGEDDEDEDDEDDEEPPPKRRGKPATGGKRRR